MLEETPSSECHKKDLKQRNPMAVNTKPKRN